MNIKGFNINVIDTILFKYDFDINNSSKNQMCRLYGELELDRYRLQFGSVSTFIEVKPFTNDDLLKARDVLNCGDCLYLGKILNIDDKKKLALIQFSRFIKRIVLPLGKKMQIHITDNILSGIPRECKDIAKFLKNEFVLDNRYLFVMGAYNDKLTKQFTIISPSKRLVVSNNEKYRTEKITKQKGGYYDKPIVVIEGEVEFTDSTYISTLPPELMQELNKSIRQGEYLNLWNLYNKLEQGLVFEKAKELGSLQYKNYKAQATENGIKLSFELTADIPDQIYSMQSSELEWSSEPITEKNFNISSKLEHFFAGRFIAGESKGKRLVTIIENDFTKNMPNKTGGYLFSSTSGDSTRIWRREQAKEIIANNTAPILGLGMLIENGTSVYKETGTLNPVTQKLLKSLNGRQPLPSQKEAISIALNTPDIAIIQGPPGTGKTTVIRAIINRLIENGEKIGYIPKILLTSYQHDAVDNAIEESQFAGIPAYRKGKRRGEKDNDLKEIIWAKQIENRCAKIIEQYPISQVKKIATELEKKIFMYYANEHSEDDTVVLLEDIFSHAVNLFDSDLRNQFEEVIIKQQSVKCQKIVDEEDDSVYIKHLNELLDSQRLSKESFEDDGFLQANRLARFLERHTVELGIATGEPLLAIIRCKSITEITDQLLQQFKEWINGVRVINKCALNIEDEKSNKITIERLLKDVRDTLRKKVITDVGTAADVVFEYAERMQNYDEIKRVIKKYSSVIATTCQQAVAKRFLSIDERNIYDVVIVDEAARANPLDLFIPMSLGKKIILVGDQKQLPHILEDKLVNEFIKQYGEESAGILRKSLFERLFNILEKQNNRTVTLNEQFRMHPVIGEMVSNCFYKELGGISSSQVKVSERMHNTGLFQNKPIAWIDVPDTYGTETIGMSKYREYEVKVIVDYIKKIVAKGIDQTIGVISFYAKQVEKLKEAIEMFNIDVRLNIKVGTVDAFQGREFDIVFLSCVRCNRFEDPRLRVGFLDDKSRLCVAFSRAKKLLVVVGDSKTVVRKNNEVIIESLNTLFETCKSGVGYYECK